MISFSSYKPDLVINIALPYQDLTIMDACLACGVNYMDTANYEPDLLVVEQVHVLLSHLVEVILPLDAHGGDSLGPRTKGKTNIGCIFTGKKDGQDKTYYIYNVCGGAGTCPFVPPGRSHTPA